MNKEFPTEILFNIMQYSTDVQDWVSFLLTSKHIYNLLYPIFICRKFKFMVLYHQKLPPCIINNKRVKHFKNKSSHYPFYVTTDENHINGHCQFTQFLLYETSGLFFSVLNFDNMNPDIDHLKLFDIISNDENITYYDSLKRVYTNKPYIQHVNWNESYRMSTQYIKNKENYRENKQKLKDRFMKFIKNYIKGDLNHIYGVKFFPELCIFCGDENKDNSKHINLHTDGHTWHEV